MNLEELISITNGTYYGKKKNIFIHHFCIDTRLLKKDDCFIALKGKNQDGHSFLETAYEKGCILSIVSKLPKKRKKKERYLVVEDTLKALWDLASFQRNKGSIPVIGITGSVGKSTLKEILAQLLEPDYRVLKSEGNQNNHIGLPMTLLKMDSNYDIVIAELGMNHKGEIQILSNLLRPSIGVITKIGTSHIGNLGSKKEICKAKLEILSGMDGGFLFLNGYDKAFKHFKGNIPCFKTNEKRNYQIKEININLKGTSFILIVNQKEYEVFFPYPGYQYPELIALAILIASKLQIPIDVCIKRLKNIKLLNQRFQFFFLNQNILLIDDSYNASYESFLSAYSYLKKEKQNKLLILGDMLELGSYSKKYHKKVIRKANYLMHTEVWYTGPVFYSLGRKFHHGTYFETIEDMKKCLEENNWEDCIIYVKGSHLFHLEQVSKAIIKKYKEDKSYNLK